MWRTRSLGLLAVLVLSASGCSLFGSDVDSIVEAGRRTTEAGTARVAVTTIIDAGFGQPKQRTDASGLIDFDQNVTQLEMRVGIPALAGASSSADGVPLLVIGDGQSMFMRSTTWPEEQPWTRVPVAGVGADGEAVDGAANDLGAQLQLLGSGVTSLEELGEEDVRGESAKRYEVLVDLEKAIQAAPDDKRASLQELADRTQDVELPLELWIGSGQVRRMSYSINIASDGAQEAATAGQANVSTVIEYFDFGIPFDFQIPVNVVDAPADGATPEASASEAAPSEPEAAFPEATALASPSP